MYFSFRIPVDGRRSGDATPGSQDVRQQPQHDLGNHQAADGPTDQDCPPEEGLRRGGYICAERLQPKDLAR